MYVFWFNKEFYNVHTSTNRKDTMILVTKHILLLKCQFLQSSFFEVFRFLSLMVHKHIFAFIFLFIHLFLSL